LVNNIIGDINQFADKTLDGIYESIQGAIAVPVEQLALQIAGASTTLSESDIAKKVEMTLGNLKNSGNGLVNECINLAVDSLLSSEKGYLVSKLVDIYNKSKDPSSTIDMINEMLYGDNGVSGLIGDLKTKVNNAVRNKVTEYGKKFTDEIGAKISEGGDNIKEEIKDKIDSFTSGIAGGDNSGNGNTAAATGFAMSYKEYLKVFFMIHLMVSDSNKDAMLMRTAELIQANVSQKSSGFNVAKAYTVIQTTANVNVRTTFFSVPVSTVSEDGNISYELDFSNIGSGKQKIKYTSVLGY
jgi:hypothetical protein